MADPWSVLGVPPGASWDEAHHAYLVRLQLVHPDRHQGMAPAVLAEAERATRELNAAWEAVQGLVSPSPDSHGDTVPDFGSPGACLQWAIDRLIAAGVREGHPLTASELELLRRPRAGAPTGRRFHRWLERRRGTLAVAVATDGPDAWAAAVRLLSDAGPSVVLTELFS
jgi:hypothetical protein